ncbi:MAG TPA: hypothetical protein VKA74_14555 [Myxococcota bacterium]|nr:hypothetical protein [Myxococcota bacterium]
MSAASDLLVDRVLPEVPESLGTGKSGKKRELILTGHGMGGAIVAYLATRLMNSGYRNVHLVTFAAPRVTTKSFVRRVDGLAESNARSVSLVERPDDPRIDDWTSQIEDLPTIRIVVAGADRLRDAGSPPARERARDCEPETPDSGTSRCGSPRGSPARRAAIQSDAPNPGDG